LAGLLKKVRKNEAGLLKKVRKNEAGLLVICAKIDFLGKSPLHFLEICAKRGFWQKVHK
jgi:hypothetical protein